MPDMILQLDRDMKVLWANKTALDIEPDVIGQTCHKAYLGKDVPCGNCVVLEAMKTGKIKVTEKFQSAVTGIKGETFWEYTGIPLLDENGDVAGAVEIARNITVLIEQGNCELYP